MPCTCSDIEHCRTERYVADVRQAYATIEALRRLMTELLRTSIERFVETEMLRIPGRTLRLQYPQDRARMRIYLKRAIEGYLRLQLEGEERPAL